MTSATLRAAVGLGPCIGLGFGLGALGCESGRAPLDLEAHVEPSEECVVIVHESLELGEAVHAFVSDGSGSRGGWALISFVNDNDLVELGVARVPASELEAPTSIVGLGLTASDPDHVILRAGEIPGELWVHSTAADLVVLRRLEPELGLTASNGSIGLFPGTSGVSCPSSHARSLVLIEGRPYILAIPDCSETPALDLDFVELDPNTLDFGTSWQLSFNPCANLDPITCAQALAYTIVDVGAGATSPLSGATRVAVGFVQTRAYVGILDPTGLPETLLRSDVSLLDMRLTQTGPTARLVTFTGVWDHTLPVELEQPTLAQDPYSVLIQVRNQALGNDGALLRFDTIGDLYLQLHDPALMPFDGRGTLLQLPSESVMVHADAGLVEAVPLLDVESWPAWTRYELHEDPSLVRVEPAGVGHLLLRREHLPPRILRVDCLN